MSMAGISVRRDAVRRKARACSLPLSNSPSRDRRSSAIGRGAEPSRLGVVGEIVGRGRAPDVERILGRVVAALPVAIGGHEIDAGRIFAERPPWVADIVEEVGAQDVPPETPAAREPL